MRNETDWPKLEHKHSIISTSSSLSCSNSDQVHSLYYNIVTQGLWAYHISFYCVQNIFEANIVSGCIRQEEHNLYNSDLIWCWSKLWVWAADAMRSHISIGFLLDLLDIATGDTQHTQNTEDTWHASRVVQHLFMFRCILMRINWWILSHI